jgi:hypothetical protein
MTFQGRSQVDGLEVITKVEGVPRIELPQITAVRLLDLPSGPAQASEIEAGPDRWHRYALSYKNAADALAKRIEQDDIQRHFLALSAMFLYRHYIELHLKSLLIDAGELLDAPQQVPRKHYLLELWHRVRALLLKIDPRDSDWLRRAGDVIEQFDALDPTSFAFRYPVGNDGESSLPEDVKVEIPSVASVIAELHILLEGASTQIDVFMGYKHEAP